MKKIVLRGPFCTRSGYGQHALQIARWALAQPNVDVKFLLTPWGNCPWLLDGALQDGLIGRIMERSVASVPPDADLSVQVQLPNEWDPHLARVNVGVTAGVETDRCNPHWISAINRMSSIIVPSSFVKRTFENTGNVTVPVHVVPEAFHDACLNEEGVRDIGFDPSTSFNFLIFGQITGNNQANDRKNTFSAIKWLCDVFSENADVGIVVKTNLGRNSVFDRQATLRLFKQLVSEVRPKVQQPKIHLLHGEMTDSEVAALYKHPTIKALVAPTRGEGYGLPILEAAACGLPVAATNWSGHLDFMSHGKFMAFEHVLQPLHPSRIDANNDPTRQIFMPGARWAEVSEASFKQKMKKFYINSTVPKDWARDLQKKIVERFSFEAISKKYDEVLGAFVK